jgi:hypothetical protein
MYEITADANLVGTQHMFIKYFASNPIDQGVCNPSAIMTSCNLTEFVRSDLLHRHLIGFGVILDRNLRRHATHSSNLPPKSTR